MSYSYDRYDRQRRQTYGASSRRSALGYWLPLAVTVTVATVGLVAWIWSERKEDESDDYDRGGEDRPPRGPSQDPPRGPSQGPSQGPPTGFSGPGSGQMRGQEGIHMEEESVMSRMSGALRRTPSPQQLFDGASRRVAAGVAAAGAVVGGALSSIREEDKRDFEDHSRWSEEAEIRGEVTHGQSGIRQRQGEAEFETRPIEPSSSMRQITQPGTSASEKQRTVAMVVSADIDEHYSEDAAHHEEHASILSHLPHHIDAKSRVFVLIYAPDLGQHPLKGIQSSQPPLSLTSSYSNIGHEDAQGHGEGSEKPLSVIDPKPLSSPSKPKAFNRLYAQAQGLVDNDTMIMPFTTATGHIHLLRHISPEVVYIQETLTGLKGDVITNISKWVGQIVLVVGDESGHGGLVDSEDEHGHAGEDAREKWWQDDPRIGLGKGVEVVEGLRVGEDWRRRVGGYD